MFNNEHDILEGRIKYLNDVVNFFVIVEIDTTHSGKDKELNFTKEISRYQKYLNKILYIPVSIDKSKYDVSKVPESVDFSSPQWKIENEHRNKIINGLRFFNPKDFVIISDVDEIPLKSAIISSSQNLSDKRIAITFEQDMFYYNFKQRQVNKWCGSVITTNQKVMELSPQFFRDQRWNLPKITNGGYHLSYWNTPEKIVEKIESFAHQELNKKENKDLDVIKLRIDNGEDLFKRENNPFEKVSKNEINKEIYSVFKTYEKEIK
jgi:beta-1,4-mannosyl-glycoprotein beta-1,4-N-acetylglucosaminyltransferase